MELKSNNLIVEIKKIIKLYELNYITEQECIKQCEKVVNKYGDK